MKAAVCNKYGSPDVVKIVEVNKPTPSDNEILVKVIATTITAGDSRIRGARFPKGLGLLARLGIGISAPRNKILGSEFSGIVESVGKDVKKFKINDKVIGFKLFNVHAEYTTIQESKALVIKPENLSFKEAASIPFGGTTALYFLKRAKVSSNQKILINGASGSVGVMAVQIVKAFGAEVTAVCGTENIDLVKNLGADIVIDYTKENALNDSRQFDVIFDAVGNLKFTDSLKNLNDNGRFIALVASLKEMIFQKNKGNKEFISGTAPENKEDLEFLIKLVEQGKLKSVIGKEFDFSEIAKAHEYADSGKKVGAAVVNVSKE